MLPPRKSVGPFVYICYVNKINMKIGIFPAAVIGISVMMFSCAGKKVRSDLANEDFHGKVKRITEILYTVNEKFGQLQKDELEEKRVYSFDEQGKATAATTSDRLSDADYATRSIYKFGSDGKLTGCVSTFGRENKPLSTIDYKYDAKGRMVEDDVNYGSAGDYIIVTKYSFDDKGLCTEKKTYDRYGSTFRVTKLKYNEKELLSESGYLDGGTQVRVTYTYDNFDNEGNWRKRVRIFNDKPQVIAEREIEYY